MNCQTNSIMWYGEEIQHTPFTILYREMLKIQKRLALFFLILRKKAEIEERKK